MMPLTPAAARKISKRSPDEASTASRSPLVVGMSSPRVTGVLVLFAAALMAFQPGCTVYQNARRTMFREPAQYGWKADRKHSIKAYRAWADQAWSHQFSTPSGMPYSSDYEAGFKDGFVDFVYAGGSGEPPPVPPRRYWNLDHRTPQGQNAAADWFAGFRLGARVAREEGYREQATIDSSVYALGPLNSDSHDNYYYPDDFSGAAPHAAEPIEELPHGELNFEPEQEILESEELPAQGPLISQPPRDLSPSLPTPEPAEESDPPTDPPGELEDLFGSRRSESSSLARSKAGEISLATAHLPERNQSPSTSPKNRFIRQLNANIPAHAQIRAESETLTSGQSTPRKQAQARQSQAGVMAIRPAEKQEYEPASSSSLQLISVGPSDDGSENQAQVTSR